MVNLSTVYRELPRDERPGAAAAEGFTRVESWWEFGSATPEPEDFARFLAALDDAEVELVAINAHGGNREHGERGLALLPGRDEEFRASIQGIEAVNMHTGVRRFNVTVGNLTAQADCRELLKMAAGRYRWACKQMQRLDGTLLVEPLAITGNPDYPFRTGEDIAKFFEEYLADVPNIGILFDTYHLASNGVDPVRAARELAPFIKHVQFADLPGRGAPGTGIINFSDVERELEEFGYSGEISLEYLR